MKRFTGRSVGQVTVEFAFCLIIVAVLMYGLVKAFRWAGLDLAERRLASETDLTMNIDENWDPAAVNVSGPARQLVSNYYKTKRMSLVFNRW